MLTLTLTLTLIVTPSLTLKWCLNLEISKQWTAFHMYTPWGHSEIRISDPSDQWTFGLVNRHRNFEIYSQNGNIFNSAQSLRQYITDEPLQRWWIIPDNATTLSTNQQISLIPQSTDDLGQCDNELEFCTMLTFAAGTFNVKTQNAYWSYFQPFSLAWIRDKFIPGNVDLNLTVRPPTGWHVFSNTGSWMTDPVLPCW